MSSMREKREKLKRHFGLTVWLTGLSGSGKTTIATELERQLNHWDIHTIVLDGDNVRNGLNKNLGFSPEDRKENIRRIGEVAKLFREAGIVNIVSFISPYREDRQTARDLSEGHDFIEVFIDCSLKECEKRDPKGLYIKARAGELKDFTGISAPYELPEKADLVINTEKTKLEWCVKKILDEILSRVSF